jgi:predicted kinase
MVNQLVITRGLPASGKTTYAKQWVAEDPSARARVNRDDLRAMLFGLEGYTYDHEREKAVTRAQHRAIKELLALRKSVIVDDTNLRARTVRELRQIAVAAKAEFVIEDQFLQVDRVECQRRNMQRTGTEQVAPEVIDRMYDRYLRGGLAPIPEDPVKDYSVLEPYVPDRTLPYAVIFDIDGTLALMGDRDPFDGSKAHLDTVNESVADVLHALSYVGYEIVFLTGRKERFREVTENWLYDKHLNLWHSPVFMRPDDDDRPDWQVKYDLFNTNVRGKYDVLGVFDDRQQVVDMWRAIGLTCFQVAEGDF